MRSTPHVASQTDVSDSEAAEMNGVINPAQVLVETAALENYFQCGFGQEMNNLILNDEEEESDDGEDEQEGVISDNEEQIVDNPKTRPALAWADKFILDMRRKGGRQTENSVLKLWKVCRKSLRKFLGVTLRQPGSHCIYLDMGFRCNRFWPPARHNCRFKSHD